MEKSEIRKTVKEKKRILSKAYVEQYSKMLCDVFTSQSFYRDAAFVYAYLAYNTEIITNGIIERAWADGKTVAVPKVFDDGVMEFIKIDTFDDISEGYCGIPEPVKGEIVKADSALIIMPGLAFDKAHNRIGYGGGFYDRYLERYADCRFTKISLAYDFQIFNQLETEAHDQKVDAIVTETGIL